MLGRYSIAGVQNTVSLTSNRLRGLAGGELLERSKDEHRYGQNYGGAAL